MQLPPERMTDEPLSERVGRQLATGKLDEERLLPSREKRTRQIAKKLDRMAAHGGWYLFVAGQAHVVKTGPARKQRNAEITIVTEAGRWLRDVRRFVPERLDEFFALIDHALEHPKPLARREGR